MITIGIDPDSKAHGVAIYSKGELKSLEQWTLPEIIKYIMQPCMKGQIMFSIEDAKLKKCVYRQHSTAKARAQGEIGRRLGLCQQAQIELERVLESFAVPYVNHPPQKGNWANMKDMFETVTGWKGRSNKDTRSAAYMGYLGLKQTNRLLAANQ